MTNVRDDYMPWNAEMDALVCECARKGMTANECKALFDKRFARAGISERVTKSRDAIRIRGARLGVRFRREPSSPRPKRASVASQSTPWQEPCNLPPSSRSVTVALIANVTASGFGVNKEAFLSTRRNSQLVRARQIAMYLAREMTPASYPLIGRVLGDRDHTTIMYGAKRVEESIPTDEALARDVAAIKATVRQITGAAP